ncbi:MAG: UDP-glucose/GDP-mannose dehydrogenase family protein [Desulfotomaculaceae bacterium]|nr:UDP-glucose/GDP-mannose dehydrogenase family protein [Desulfotomaculaceae bacterium]
MARLCVVGMGYVGLVTALCFAKLGNSVIGVDKDINKLKLLSEGSPTFYEHGLDELLREGLEKGKLSFTNDINRSIEQSEIIFICVGTPPGENGRPDLSQVEEVARSIAINLKSYKLIVEKSTVPAGTAERIKQTIKLAGGEDTVFDVASNPEFLREGSAIADFSCPDRIVLGVDTSMARTMLKELYRDFDCPVLITDIATAELIKHASNAFLATKISFSNLVADICEKVGANINLVVDGLGYDRRIGREFLNAGIGYGGSCFPKDVKAFAAMAGALGVNNTLLKEVDRINEDRIGAIVKKIEDALWVCKNKRIALLGLAFKCNTDDIRESPGIKLVRELVRKGSLVTCYDPKAMDNARGELKNLGDVLSFAETPYVAASEADALVLMTEWPEFVQLDFLRMKKLMRTPVIIDGRNMLQAEEIEKIGFWYSGIGCHRGNRKSKFQYDN